MGVFLAGLAIGVLMGAALGNIRAERREHERAEMLRRLYGRG